MKKVIILGVVLLALSMISCNSRSGKLAEIKKIQDSAVAKYKAEAGINGKGHNITIRFIGKDQQIPKDGQLMVVKCTLEDTVLVDVATLDDSRRVLEENGKG